MPIKLITASENLDASGKASRWEFFFDLPKRRAKAAVAWVLPLLLVGGQILFPAKSYEVQQVALQDKIEMNGATAKEPAEPQPFDADARVASSTDTYWKRCALPM